MAQLLPFNYFNQTSSKIILAKGCFLTNFDGESDATGYLQIFDSATVPTSGTGVVPRKEIIVATAGQLSSYVTAIGSIPFVNGLVFAMSSTSGTYTAQATVFDIWGEIEVYETAVSGLTTTTTGSADSVTVWSNIVSNNTKRLYKATITNGDAAEVWAMFFPTAFAGSASPLMERKIAIGATEYFSFGLEGTQFLGSSVTAVAQNGCYIALSTTPTIFSATSSTASTFVTQHK